MKNQAPNRRNFKGATENVGAENVATESTCRKRMQRENVYWSIYSDLFVIWFIEELVTSLTAS